MQLDHEQITTVAVAVSGPQDEDLAFAVGRDCGGRGKLGGETGQERETKQTKREKKTNTGSENACPINY